MKMTFARLAAYMHKHSTNVEVKGRDAAYNVQDAMQLGTAIFIAAAEGGTAGADDSDDWVDLQDNEIDVEDDGSLDVD